MRPSAVSGIFVSALILITAACAPQLQAPPKKKETAMPIKAPFLANNGKLVLMHYMPWYKTPVRRGAWGSHWTGHQQQHNPDRIKENGLPDIWSNYHPLIGLYDSTDPQVVECHLLQMKLAGVHGVIADWYGISDTADYPEIHESTKVLFDVAAKLGMQFAVCYEDRTIQLMVDWKKITPDQVTNHLAETFQWLEQHWFAADHYVRLGDRPLFLNFGPIYVQGAEVWKTAMQSLQIKPAFYALHHLWRSAGADGGFTWVHYDPWQGTPDEQQIKTRIREVFDYCSRQPDEVIVSACPGFNDVYEQKHPSLAYRDGATLKEMLDVGLNGPWPVVQLATWNDYGEGTMFEPTHEFGYLFLEILQEQCRPRQPELSTVSKEDLRLPARLLALRVKGLPDEPLDRVAGLLARGDTRTASIELDKLEATVK